MPNTKFDLILPESSKHRILLPNDRGPEVIHLVASGFKDEKGNPEWFVFTEDAYQTEPHKSGVQRLTEAEIEEKYSVNLNNFAN